jgi:hypothetical protein
MIQPKRTSELWIELSQDQQEKTSGGLNASYLELPLSIDFPSIGGLGGKSPFWPSKDEPATDCVRREIPTENGRNVEVICERRVEKHI